MANTGALQLQYGILLFWYPEPESVPFLLPSMLADDLLSDGLINVGINCLNA